MRVAADVFADPQALGRRAAELVADGLERSRAAGRPYLLGCPGGRSAATTYQALAGAGRPARPRPRPPRRRDDGRLPGPRPRRRAWTTRTTRPRTPASASAASRSSRPLDRAAGRGRGVPADAPVAARPARPRRATTTRSPPPAASTSSCWPPAPATGTSPSTRPARRRTAGPASSTCPTAPAGTTWPPSPPSAAASTPSPGTASPWASRRSCEHSRVGRHARLRRRQGPGRGPPAARPPATTPAGPRPSSPPARGRGSSSTTRRWPRAAAVPAPVG